MKMLHEHGGKQENSFFKTLFFYDYFYLCTKMKSGFLDLIKNKEKSVIKQMLVS